MNMHKILKKKVSSWPLQHIARFWWYNIPINSLHEWIVYGSLGKWVFHTNSFINKNSCLFILQIIKQPEKQLIPEASPWLMLIVSINNVDFTIGRYFLENNVSFLQDIIWPKTWRFNILKPTSTSTFLIFVQNITRLWF